VRNNVNAILVVGGAGYVGSELVRELLNRGFADKIFDRLYFGDRGLADVRERVELVVGDMRSMRPGLLDGVSAVVNLGGLSNDPTAEYNPRANHEMNTMASVTLAQQCKERGVERFLFASSCSIYDFGVGDDEKDAVMDEDSKVEPKAAYSSSKFEAEKLLVGLATEQFCPVILRKGTVYGFSPRMRYDFVVNTFVKDALSRGYILRCIMGEKCGGRW
jgi:nucleoside-diphosphate-sugar epimerase